VYFAHPLYPSSAVTTKVAPPTLERSSGLAPVHAPLNDLGMTAKEARDQAEWDGGGRK